MALTVREGSLISSIKYKMRSEGRAMTIKMMAGKIVQIVSISWASIAFVLVNFVVIITVIIYNTRVLIRNAAIRA